MVPSEFILGVKQRITRWIHRVGHPLQGEDAKLGITGWGAKSLRNPVDEQCPRSRIIIPQTVCPQCGVFTVRVKAGAWSRCSLWLPALFPVNFSEQMALKLLLWDAHVHFRLWRLAQSGCCDPGAWPFSCKFSLYFVTCLCAFTTPQASAKCGLRSRDPTGARKFSC